MSLLLVIVAYLLPTLFGAGVVSLFIGRPRRAADAALLLACGYVIGALLFGVLTAPLDAPPRRWLALVGPWLGFALLGLGVMAWRGGVMACSAGVDDAPAGRAARAVIGVLLVLLVLRAFLLFQQALDLPTLAWDAWTVWLAKPNAWLQANAMRPMADLNVWLAAGPETVLFGFAPNYPEAVPRYLTWIGGVVGGWNEPALHLAWPLLWLALGASLFGLLRAEGVSAVHALFAAYIVLSLPIVSTHAALAGYADLWLAALLLMALAFTLRAGRHGSRRELALALVCAVLLPAIKNEGAIWMLLLLAVTALSWLRPAHRVIASSVILIAAAGVIALGEARFYIPGLGPIEYQAGVLILEHVGRFELYWRPVLGQILDALFILPNWSLLWWAAPIAMLACAKTVRANTWLGQAAGFLALAYAFVGFLFLFTEASEWAENLTSFNRVVMQLVPATVYVVALALSLREAKSQD